MGDIYNGCLWEKYFVFCRIKLKFCFWLYKKIWHTSWKFQLEITSNKKVIAKKPLTNLYEMNSTLCVMNVSLSYTGFDYLWLQIHKSILALEAQVRDFQFSININSEKIMLLNMTYMYHQTSLLHSWPPIFHHLASELWLIRSRSKDLAAVFQNLDPFQWLSKS